MNEHFSTYFLESYVQIFLEQGFLNSNVHRNDQGSLVNSRFWFKIKVGLRGYISDKSHVMLLLQV